CGGVQQQRGGRGSGVRRRDPGADSIARCVEPRRLDRRRPQQSRGDMWPMVAGVGAVLGEGVAGYFVPPSGAQTPGSYRAGAALSGTTEIVRTSQPYMLLGAAPRVAVLTDNLVASSGEAVVVSFRARSNTRSFGATTCGQSTANAGFRLV